VIGRSPTVWYQTLNVDRGGIPVLTAGLLLYRRLGDDGGQGYLRTAALALALVGSVVLLTAVALAWPEPLALTLVCAVDCAIFSAAAYRARLPGLHALALACLGLGYLTGYHLLAGQVGGGREELGRFLLVNLLSPASCAAAWTLRMPSSPPPV